MVFPIFAMRNQTDVINPSNGLKSLELSAATVHYHRLATRNYVVIVAFWVFGHYFHNYSLTRPHIQARESNPWGQQPRHELGALRLRGGNCIDDLIQPSHYVAHWRPSAQLAGRTVPGVSGASHWALIVGRGNNKACL